MSRTRTRRVTMNGVTTDNWTSRGLPRAQRPEIFDSPGRKEVFLLDLRIDREWKRRRRLIKQQNRQREIARGANLPVPVVPKPQPKATPFVPISKPGAPAPLSLEKLKAVHRYLEVQLLTQAKMRQQIQNRRCERSEYDDGDDELIPCPVHNVDPLFYESRFEIPTMLMQAQDCVSRGLPEGKKSQWPERFVSSIRVGSDLSRVGWQFLRRLLTDVSVNPGIRIGRVNPVIRTCLKVLWPITKGEEFDEIAFFEARTNALSEAIREPIDDAELKLTQQDRNEWNEAEASVWSAVRALDGIVQEAVLDAAESVEWHASRTNSGTYNAKTAAYEKMADILLELISAAAAK